MEISSECLFSSKPGGNFLSTCISFRKPFTCVAIARKAQRGGFVGRAAVRRVRERCGGAPADDRRATVALAARPTARPSCVTTRSLSPARIANIVGRYFCSVHIKCHLLLLPGFQCLRIAVISFLDFIICDFNFVTTVTTMCQLWSQTKYRRWGGK